MNFSRLEQRIMEDEGFRAQPYLDTVGVPTIGYGTTHILGRPVTMDAQTMAPSIARQLLRMDLYGACVDAQAVVPGFDELDSVRQEVCVNMAYNLGRKGLEGFRKFRQWMEVHSYEAAAEEMLQSRWSGQVGQRAKRLATEMASGRSATQGS